jgi:predicted permease
VEGALIVIKQVFILFCLIAMGYGAVKAGLFSRKGVDEVTSILLYFVMPFVVLELFLRPIENRHLNGLLIAFVAGGLCHILGGLTAKLFLGRRDPETRDVLSNAVVLSNSAFMAIPLVSALVGSEGTLYLAAYLVWFNTTAWTYSVRTMDRSVHKLRIKDILLNPTILAVIFGLLLVLFRLHIPSPFSDIISMTAATNSPVAMMLIGAQIALTRPRLIPSKDVLLAAVLRNFLIPLIMLGVLLPLTGDRTLFFSILIPAAAPTAATVVLFSSRFGRNVRLASEIMTFSTLASIVSLPLLTLIADALLRIKP